jgi:hypothetical protein
MPRIVVLLLRGLLLLGLVTGCVLVSEMLPWYLGGMMYPVWMLGCFGLLYWWGQRDYAKTPIGKFAREQAEIAKAEAAAAEIAADSKGRTEPLS